MEGDIRLLLSLYEILSVGLVVLLLVILCWILLYHILSYIDF